MIPVIYGEYGVGKTTMARYLFLDKDKNGLLVNIESTAGKTIKDIFSHSLGFYEEFEEVIIYLTNIEKRFFKDL